jgi:hypothetical protein
MGNRQTQKKEGLENQKEQSSGGAIKLKNTVQ